MWMVETLKFKNTASECDNVSNVGNVDDWQYSDLKSQSQNVRMLVI